MHANDFYTEYVQDYRVREFLENATKEEIESTLRSILEFSFVGTCQSLYECLEGYGVDEEDFFQRLVDNKSFDKVYDEIAFACDHCGWNYSKEEANNYYGDCICNSCYDEMVEDEDEEEEEEWESEDDDDEEY